MRLGKPTISLSSKPGYFRIQTDVDLDREAGQYPGTLWYEFPEQYQDWLYMGVEPYVLSLLQFAMARGENIEAAGPFSQRLEYNLRGYQEVYRQWYPENFKPVQLRHAGPAVAPTSGSQAATLFSGGVDSFYTLLQQLADTEPVKDYQVSLAFHIFFDMERHDRQAYDQRVADLTPALADLGVTLIQVNTNMRHFLVGRTAPERHWFLNKSFVGGLTSVGMLLSGEVARLFLPGGWQFQDYHPSGTSWLTDSMLASEWYETIHHGAALTRTEKIDAIANQPLAQRFLSVCLNKPDQNRNCGDCTKCVRTMTTLDLLGKREAFTVFDSPARARPIREMSRLTEKFYIRENLSLARQHNNQRYLWLLRLTWLAHQLRRLRRDRLPDWLRRST